MTTHQLAHASFSITGDALDPAFWTSYFGILPDSEIVKGQSFVTSAGKQSRQPGRVGLWGLRSKGTIQSDTLEPHLRYLIARLQLPRDGLRELLVQQNAGMRFFCYWDNSSGDRVPDVPDDIRAMMEALGGTIEIDEYR